MTGGPVTVKAQPAAKVDASTVVKLKGELVSAIKKVESQLASMKSMGITPAINHTDASVMGMLSLLSKNASVLGLENQIKGSTDLERFRSLNNWLNSTWMSQPALSGRNQDSPLDDSVLGNLRLRLTVALSGAVTKVVAPAITKGMPTVKAAPSPVPVRVAPASALTEVQKSEYQTMISNLETISRHGTTREKRDAKKYIGGLQAILDKANATKRDVQNAERRYARYARRLIKSALASAQKRGATQPAIANVPPATLASSVKSVAQLFTELQTLAKDPSKKATADKILNRLSDLWLVGERKSPTAGKDDGRGVRWQMFALFKKAKNALQAGKESDVDAELGKANDLLKREQAVTKRFADLAVSIATTLQAKNISGSLPSKSELQASGNLMLSRKRTPKVDNSSESIAKEVKDRLSTFQSYMAANAGRASYDYVSQFYSYITGFSSTISKLVDLYSLFNTQKSSISDATARTRFEKSFMSQYANAALWLVDPDNDVWTRMPAEVQRALKRDIGRATGNTNMTDAQLSALFKAVPGWRYDAAIYSVYVTMTSGLAPKISVPASAESALKARAQLRAARIFFTSEYEFYVTKEYTNVDNRLKDASDFLDRAVKIAGQSGLPATVVKPLVDVANSWLAANKNPATKEAKLYVSEAFYHISVQIMAICQAELVARTPALRPSSVGANSAALNKAQALIKEARDEFMRGFGSPHAPLPLYPSLASNISDVAVNLLSPSALGATEAAARRATFQRYENDGMSSYVDALTKQLDENERLKVDLPLDEKDAWPARLKDRETALAAAIKNEEIYSRMLYSLKDSTAFSSSPRKDVLSTKAGLSPLMKLLDPRVTRSPETELQEFVAQRLTRNEADGTMGQVLEPGRTKPFSWPHERMAVYSLGQSYVEIDRQSVLSRDTLMPLLLRGTPGTPQAYGEAQKAMILGFIDQGQSTADEKKKMKASVEAQYVSLRAKVREVSGRMGFKDDESFFKQAQQKMYSISADQSKDYPIQQLLLNKLMIAVLDVRIAELENRLDMGIRTTDGVKISDLERSNDPRAFVVKSARQALVAAKRLRAGFENANKDLFASRVNLRQAIMIAENGLYLLRDKKDQGAGGSAIGASGATIDDIPKSSIQPKKAGDYRFTYKIIEETGRQRYSRRDFAFQGRARFRAQITVTDTKTSKAVPLSQYEKQEGSLTLLWFIYRTVPLRPGSSTRYTFLVSPKYMATPEYKTQKVVRPIGVVVRNAIGIDGKPMGDVVLRVRRTAQAEEPSKGTVWEPDLERTGRVDPAKVLYKLVKGTTYPVNDATLKKNVSTVAFRFVGADVGSVISLPQPSVENTTTSAKLMVLKPSK